MRYILLILFLTFGMGCQTMKAKNQAREKGPLLILQSDQQMKVKKQARKGWKRVDKEWFGIQAKAPASEKAATRTPGNLDCNAIYSNFAKEYGASAILDFNYRNIVDYREGHKPNYEMGCPRLFLKMQKEEGASVYKGQLTIVYLGDDPQTGRLKTIEEIYYSGDSVEKNQFNNWQGNWGENPSADFAAILESPNKAIILHITDVKRVEVRDGEQVYKGYGSVWFKVFRVFKRKGDICYNEGGYVSHAHIRPPVRPDRCWFLSNNPYGCRPQGSGRSVNLRGSLTCYKKLADFGYLDIHKAFEEQ